MSWMMRRRVHCEKVVFFSYVSPLFHEASPEKIGLSTGQLGSFTTCSCRNQLIFSVYGERCEHGHCDFLKK